MISRIVSGGQTGADRGGLDAALHTDLPHGGWAPKGFKAEDDFIPASYHLTEMSKGGYPARTEANVVDSDATLVFTYGEPTGGSKDTIAFAQKHRKPCLHVDLNLPRKDVVQKVVEWLEKECPSQCVLNVAGSRESKHPGIQLAVMVRMVDVISEVNGKLFYPLREEG